MFRNRCIFNESAQVWPFMFIFMLVFSKNEHFSSHVMLIFMLIFQVSEHTFSHDMFIFMLFSANNHMNININMFIFKLILLKIHIQSLICMLFFDVNHQKFTYTLTQSCYFQVAIIKFEHESSHSHGSFQVRTTQK